MAVSRRISGHAPAAAASTASRRSRARAGSRSTSSLPGTAHGVAVRSDRAHARIVSIDAAAAEALPGVLAVVDGAERRADRRSLRPHQPRPSGARRSTRCCYHGEPVAARRRRDAARRGEGRQARARRLRGPARGDRRRRGARRRRPGAPSDASAAAPATRASTTPAASALAGNLCAENTHRVGRRRRGVRGRRPRRRGRVPLPDALRLRDGAVQRDRRRSRKAR